MSEDGELLRPLSPGQGDAKLKTWLKDVQSSQVLVQALDLSLTWVTDDGVQALAMHYPQLHSLDLCGTAVTDEGVRTLAERCTHLQTLSLRRTQVKWA